MIPYPNATTGDLPLCGHAICDTGPRNSVLDQHGDVTIFSDCHGTWHVFRDDNPHGLILASHGDTWNLTRETHTETGTGDARHWQLIPETEAICAGGWDHTARAYLARHLPTGLVIARTDTQYGLIARAARFYLRKSAPASPPSSTKDLRGSVASTTLER